MWLQWKIIIKWNPHKVRYVFRRGIKTKNKFKINRCIRDINEDIILLENVITLGKPRIICEDAYVETGDKFKNDELVILKSLSNNINLVYDI